jgi:hypothetical protein
MVMQKFIGVLLVGLLGLTLLLTGCGDSGGGGGGDESAFVLNESRLDDPDNRIQ